MKPFHYELSRDRDDLPIVAVMGEWGGRVLKPELSQKVFNHSPDGFEWGYGGSGPAQLALAILLDAGPMIVNSNVPGILPALVLNCYQDFKREFLANLPFDGGTITSGQIEKFLADNLQMDKPAGDAPV